MKDLLTAQQYNRLVYLILINQEGVNYPDVITEMDSYVTQGYFAPASMNETLNTLMKELQR